MKNIRYVTDDQYSWEAIYVDGKRVISDEYIPTQDLIDLLKSLGFDAGTIKLIDDQTYGSVEEEFPPNLTDLNGRMK